jgi:hypothetical protein
MADPNNPTNFGDQNRLTPSVVLGFTIAGGLFACLLVVFALLMPSFLRFFESPQARLIPVFVVPAISLSGLLLCLKKRRKTGTRLP